MNNREIYAFALHALAQHQISDQTADFEERAPYLLAACCTEAQALDTAWRRSLGQTSAPALSGVRLDLEAEFPLSQPFVPLAGFYLAAMLIIDEDVELSDKFYERWCDGMASLRAQLEARIAEESAPAPSEPSDEKMWTLESIGETYFTN